MENQSLLAYLQRSLAMVMNEVTLNQAPTSNSLFAGDSEFAISLLVDSIERVFQHGRKSKFFGDPVAWDVFSEFGRRPWATALLGTANAQGDSDHEKGRIFLRFLLQHHLLVVFADELSQNEDLIEEYYDTNAIMARSDDYAIFRQQLVSLEILPLKFPGAPAQPQVARPQNNTPPASPPPKKVEQPITAPAQPPSPSPAPVAVLIASKKKKTVNRIISFDSDSTDSTAKKVAKRPISSGPGATSSGSSSLENSALSTSTDDLSLSKSLELPTAPVEATTMAEPVTTVETVPDGSETPKNDEKIELTVNSTNSTSEPDSSSTEPAKNNPVEVAALESDAPTASETRQETKTEPSEKPEPVTAADIPATDADPPVEASTAETAPPETVQPTNDGKDDNDDDETDGPLQLHVRHDDDHDSLDSASEDEGDDLEPMSVNATVDSTIEGIDESKNTEEDPEIDSAVPSADLSKLLAGFAASFSDTQ